MRSQGSPGWARRLETEAGLSVTVSAEVVVAAPDHLALSKAPDHLRYVYLNEDGYLEASTADQLVREGLAAYSSGLFDLPQLCERIFAWDNAAELSLIADHFEGHRKGLEYGAGTGRILRPLLASGLDFDAVEQSAATAHWLHATVHHAGFDNCRVFNVDMQSFVSISSYDFALAGLNTLRYLNGIGGAVRHFAAAAACIVPGGAYIFHVASFGRDDVRRPPGPQNRWQVTDAAGDTVSVEWSLVRHQPQQGLDLERVKVWQGEELIHDEYQNQVACSIADWIQAAQRSGYWKVEMVADERGTSISLGALIHSHPAANYWFVLSRTDFR